MVLSFLVATCGFAKGVAVGAVAALALRSVMTATTEKR